MNDASVDAARSDSPIRVGRIKEEKIPGRHGKLRAIAMANNEVDIFNRIKNYVYSFFWDPATYDLADKGRAQRLSGLNLKIIEKPAVDNLGVIEGAAGATDIPPRIQWNKDATINAIIVIGDPKSNVQKVDVMEALVAEQKHLKNDLEKLENDPKLKKYFQLSDPEKHGNRLKIVFRPGILGFGEDEVSTKFLDDKQKSEERVLEQLFLDLRKQAQVIKSKYETVELCIIDLIRNDALLRKTSTPRILDAVALEDLQRKAFVDDSDLSQHFDNQGYGTELKIFVNTMMEGKKSLFEAGDDVSLTASPKEKEEIKFKIRTLKNKYENQCTLEEAIRVVVIKEFIDKEFYNEPILCGELILYGQGLHYNHDLMELVNELMTAKEESKDEIKGLIRTKVEKLKAEIHNLDWLKGT